MHHKIQNAADIIESEPPVISGSCAAAKLERLPEVGEAGSCLVCYWGVHDTPSTAVIRLAVVASCVTTQKHLCTSPIP